jgi:hypothetical protein
MNSCVYILIHDVKAHKQVCGGLVLLLLLFLLGDCMCIYIYIYIYAYVCTVRMNYIAERHKKYSRACTHYGIFVYVCNVYTCGRA